MIYSAKSPDLPHYIDRYRTGNYGEDGTVSHIKCSRCGGVIKYGDSYYLLGDTVYCMSCREYAEAHILNVVCDSYIYVL